MHQRQRGALVAGQLLELADDLLGLGRVGRDLQPDLGRRGATELLLRQRQQQAPAEQRLQVLRQAQAELLLEPVDLVLGLRPHAVRALHDLVPGGADGVTGVGHRQGHGGVGRQLGQRGRLGARHRGGLGAATDTGQLQVGGVEAERERQAPALSKAFSTAAGVLWPDLACASFTDLRRVGPARQDALLPQRLHVLDVRRVRGQRALVDGGVEAGALALLGEQRVAVAEGDVGVLERCRRTPPSAWSIPARASSSSLTCRATATLTSPGSVRGQDGDAEPVAEPRLDVLVVVDRPEVGRVLLQRLEQLLPRVTAPGEGVVDLGQLPEQPDGRDLLPGGGVDVHPDVGDGVARQDASPAARRLRRAS